MSTNFIWLSPNLAPPTTYEGRIWAARQFNSLTCHTPSPDEALDTCTHRHMYCSDKPGRAKSDIERIRTIKFSAFWAQRKSCLIETFSSTSAGTEKLPSFSWLHRQNCMKAEPCSLPCRTFSWALVLRTRLYCFCPSAPHVRTSAVSVQWKSLDRHVTS